MDCGERKVGRLRGKGDGLGKVGKAGKEGLIATVDDDEKDDEDDGDEDKDGDDDGDGSIRR